MTMNGDKSVLHHARFIVHSFVSLETVISNRNFTKAVSPWARTRKMTFRYHTGGVMLT